MQIQNKFLKADFKLKGAELISLNKFTCADGTKDTQILWNGDSTFWGKHSPILFPIVGSLKENEYYVDKNNYILPRHGFARDLDFNIVEKTNDSITFSLKWSKETLKIYPFKFELFISYKLIKNTLKIDFKVKNLDDKEIYFSLGAHPAFNIWNDVQESKKVEKNAYLKFLTNDGKLAALKYNLLDKNGLLKPKEYGLRLNDGFLKLEKSLFYKDALIFDNTKNKIEIVEVWEENAGKNQSKNVQNIEKIDTQNYPTNATEIASLKNLNRKLSVNLKDWTHLGLWSAKNSPFVCIEPWMGVADKVNTNQEFKDKDGVIHLKQKNFWEKTYKIKVY